MAPAQSAATNERSAPREETPVPTRGAQSGNDLELLFARRRELSANFGQAFFVLPGQRPLSSVDRTFAPPAVDAVHDLNAKARERQNAEHVHRASGSAHALHPDTPDQVLQSSIVGRVCQGCSRVARPAEPLNRPSRQSYRSAGAFHGGDWHTLEIAEWLGSWDRGIAGGNVGRPATGDAVGSRAPLRRDLDGLSGLVRPSATDGLPGLPDGRSPCLRERSLLVRDHGARAAPALHLSTARRLDLLAALAPLHPGGSSPLGCDRPRCPGRPDRHEHRGGPGTERDPLGLATVLSSPLPRSDCSCIPCARTCSSGRSTSSSS